jgi:phage tail-like protein
VIAAPTAVAQDRGETLNKYSFRLEIEGVDAGHFTSVDGLSIEQEVIEYQNGDDPLLRKRPGRVKYGNVTLTKPYSPGSVLNDWIEEARIGNGDYTRKTVAIVMFNSSGTELKRWNLYQAFPGSWQLSMLINDDKETLSEQLVIIYEWFEET